MWSYLCLEKCILWPPPFLALKRAIFGMESDIFDHVLSFFAPKKCHFWLCFAIFAWKMPSLDHYCLKSAILDLFFIYFCLKNARFWPFLPWKVPVLTMFCHFLVGKCTLLTNLCHVLAVLWVLKAGKTAGQTHQSQKTMHQNNPKMRFRGILYPFRACLAIRDWFPKRIRTHFLTGCRPPLGGVPAILGRYYHPSWGLTTPRGRKLGVPGWVK